MRRIQNVLGGELGGLRLLTRTARSHGALRPHVPVAQGGSDPGRVTTPVHVLHRGSAAGGRTRDWNLVAP